MANARAAQIAGHLNYPKGMFPGQTVIVTGSGQGIGAEAVRLFANEGANVVVSDIDAGRSTIQALQTPASLLTSPAAKAKSVADNINQSGGRALAVPGDMLSDAYINELVKKAAEFGNGKIHVIVNNAGYTWDGVIHKVGMAELEVLP